MLLYLLTLIGIICVTSQSSYVEEQLHLSESGSTKASINSIPGGSTFNFCPESSPDTDLFTVERIYWDPDPPTMYGPKVHLFSNLNNIKLFPVLRSRNS